MAKPSIERGDWVRYLDYGALNIAEVVYVREPERYPFHDWELVTDKRVVRVSEVLETRRPTPTPESPR